MSQPHDTGPDERLRKAFASLAATALPPGADCPSVEHLWRCARGEGTPAEVTALAAHLAGCPGCAEAWRLAAALREPEAQLLRPARFWRTSSLLAGAAAAALVAVVALVRRERAAEPGPMRGQPSGQVRAEVSEAPLADCELRWTPLPFATYDLSVTRADGSKVAGLERPIRPAARLPLELMRGLRAGDRIYWRVTARLDDGRLVASPTFPLLLR